MKFIRERRVSTFTALLALSMTATVFWGWLLDIPTWRSLIPGLPQMIPATALTISLLALSLLLLSTTADRPETIRSRVAAVTCLIAIFFGGFSFLLHIVPLPVEVVLNLFYDRVQHAEGVMFRGRMSVQTSLATVFLGLSLVMFRRPGRHRSFYFFETFLVAGASLCLIAIISYLHDMSMSGPSKLIGMSLPSSISFFLISIGAVFLKIDEGLVKSLRSRDGAGLFLRFYIPFSVLFPLFWSVFFHWGEEAGFYPPVISKTLFTVVIIFSLVILGVFMASGIRKLDSQRMAMEKAEARSALEQKEESLRLTQESLEMALEASSMGTWETDLVTGRLMLSSMAQALMKFSQDNITSEKFFSRIHPDDQEYCRQARRDTIDKGADLNVTFRYLYPDGSIRWLRSQGRAKYDRFGRAVKLNGTILDITDVKNHQKQLEEALKEAESASSLKSTFLANMSHEIRTPLGAILGFADVLNDPGVTQEERSRYVQIIRRNGETLSHILNDILDLSKVESGHLNVEKIRFSLPALIAETLSLLEVRAKEKNLLLRVDYAPGVPEFIVSDPVRLKQILVNLVGNALKFTSKGEVCVSLTAQGSQIHVEISDTGIGIDAEKQKNLFKAFSQADSSITRLFGGTGLGLVLSQKLAALLGGTIRLVRSEVGRGSTFLVTFEDFRNIASRSPEKGARVGAVGAETGTTDKPLQGLKILLTEDSPDIQKLLTLILKKDGASVDLAINGADCLEKYRLQDYDLILMDIQMPIMDGYTAARKLRAEGFNKPILALTAHAMSDEHQRCLQAGCDGYLSKPIQRQKLVDLILSVHT